MTSKQILILRGTSSSGKTTLSNLICQQVGNVEISADHYFYDEDGNYNFDASKLGKAHDHCKKMFMLFLNEPSVNTIVVSNVNAQEKDWKFYEDEGKKAGAMIIFLVIERRHDNINSHSVPEHVLERQEQNIRNNLKLR
jgi:hypothetical protein